MTGSLEGKVAFVTGGGSGIGRAICKFFSREGATVIVADINFTNAEETVSLLQSKTNNLAVAVDVANTDSIKTSYEIILAKFKSPPSIIVNAAGIASLTAISDLQMEELDKILNVNLKGPIFVTQTYANGMVKHNITDGSIINITSIAATSTNEGWGPYSVSKAALRSFTSTTALEYAKYGIRCNAISPGIIKTPLINVTDEDSIEKLTKLTAIGRIGLPEEVAEVAVFLASSKSSFVTGSSYEVSGGYRL